jgi:hypothetical protein
MQLNLPWAPEEDPPQAKTFRKSSNFSGRSKMFPYHQMAVPMMPQAHAQYILCFAAYSGGCGISIVGCNICTATCHDTQGWGGGCGCSRYSPIEIQAAPEDPARALEELRKGLELQLAGVQAQERLLNQRKSAEEKK